MAGRVFRKLPAEDATAVGRTAPLDEPIILPDGRQYRGQFDRYGAVGTGSGTLVFPGGVSNCCTIQLCRISPEQILILTFISFYG